MVKIISYLNMIDQDSFSSIPGDECIKKSISLLPKMIRYKNNIYRLELKAFDKYNFHGEEYDSVVSITYINFSDEKLIIEEDEPEDIDDILFDFDDCKDITIDTEQNLSLSTQLQPYKNESKRLILGPIIFRIDQLQYVVDKIYEVFSELDIEYKL